MERDESFIENQQKIVREFSNIIFTIDKETIDLQKTFKRAFLNNKEQFYLSVSKYTEFICSETKQKKVKD